MYVFLEVSFHFVKNCNLQVVSFKKEIIRAFKGFHHQERIYKGAEKLSGGEEITLPTKTEEEIVF